MSTDGKATPPTVSVVIPTRNAVSTLAACIISCLGQEDVDLEVIVVDNSSDDGTADVARSMGCTVFEAGPERSAQRNAGAAASRGEWLLFLDADMDVQPGAIRSAVTVCVNDGAVACIVPERAHGEGFWAACRELEKEVYLGDPDVEAARLFHRDVFFAHGGYDEAIHGGGEDWDLPARVAKDGGRISRACGEIVHLEGRLQLREAARKKFYYGRTLGRYIRKQPRLASRQLLRRSFLRQWRLLASRPLVAGGLLVLKAVDFTAGGFGMAISALGSEHPVDRSRHGIGYGGRSLAGVDVLILSLGFSPNIGGLETHLDDLVSELTAQGRSVGVSTLQPFTTAASGLRHEMKPSLEIVRLRWFGRGWFFWLARHPALGFLYTVPPMLAAAVKGRKFKPTVVYAQGLAAGVAATFVFPRTTRVIGIHSDLDFSGVAARVVGYVLRSVDAVLCLSERTREQCVTLGVRPEQVTTFRYWVDLERFRPLSKVDAKRRLGLQDRFVALYVGRLIEEKGIDVALEAAALLPDVIFLFVGAGPEAAHIDRQAAERRNVLHAGSAQPAELPVLYAAADALIVPSVSEEGFGRVILEALACEVPVIASRRGAIPEALTDDVGILIDPSPAALADAIDLLRQEPAKAERMAERTRNFAMDRYSRDNARVIEAVLFANDGPASPGFRRDRVRNPAAKAAQPPEQPTEKGQSQGGGRYHSAPLHEDLRVE